MEHFDWRGFKIPLDLVMITGGGPSTFEEISKKHLEILNSELDISTAKSVIEIGCGIGRDAIPLAQGTNSISSYIGIDIIRESISWCEKNISSKYPLFNFAHFDVKDQLHNPQGKKTMDQVSLPAVDSSVDAIFGWSVFTHMYEKDIQVYLGEMLGYCTQKGKRIFLASWLTEKP